ncbi:helix-turn-helix domain-containing protein [bacterium]|nr:MAG: helix-turn-helix domain-containing protein [bacterium]
MTAIATTQRPARLLRPARKNNPNRTRVRLEPESRAQLIERLNNPQMSLHEVATVLYVTRATVRRYAESGRLPCIWTPGGQRRFLWRDVLAFIKAQPK